MNKLTGKVAVVTGASKGIGAAIAKELAAEGASVVVNYATSKAGGQKVVDAIRTAGGEGIAVAGDVTKAAEAQGIIDAAIQHYGKLDILVNNAGMYAFAPLEKITEEDFHRHFDLNVLGLLLVTQAAVKHLREGGSIINLGALISRHPLPGGTVYGASKAAVDAITGTLAKELGGRRIRVNSLNPGPVATEGSAVFGEDFLHHAVAQTPLGRVGQPRDIATVAVFLASDDAGWLTGERLFASGGF